MIELAFHYKWTLDYIRTLTVRELDLAREYMRQQQQQSQGGGQVGNGNKRYS